MEAAVFETKPLLGPDQAQTMQEEMRSLEEKMLPVNRDRFDQSATAKQLQRVRRDFESQVARPPDSPAERDRMVSRANLLLSEMLADGPCSREEMRKAPPGAVEKHLQWEKRNKLKRAEWQNIQKRLHADGIAEKDSWNFEIHRPNGSSLNMDNAFIPGRAIYIPPNVGSTVTFNAQQIEMLRLYDPRLADMLGMLNNEQRKTVKELVEQAQGLGLSDEPSQASVDGKRGVEKREAIKKKRTMSPEQKQKMADGRARAKAAKE